LGLLNSSHVCFDLSRIEIRLFFLRNAPCILRLSTLFLGKLEGNFSLFTLLSATTTRCLTHDC
jgi:hypothetical protein